MGKAEGLGENWHGHVTAVTARHPHGARQLRPRLRGKVLPALQVAPEYRRQGLAQKLMGLLEETTIKRCARGVQGARKSL